MSRTAAELLRQQYKQAEDWLVGTLEGVTPEAMTYAPPGDGVSPIAGQLSHTVVGLDVYVVSMVGEREPLIATRFAGAGVLSEPPPDSASWLEWGKRVQVDETAMREYRKAVFQTIDEILANLDDDDLSTETEFASFGKTTLSEVFTIMLMNTFSHTGEISAIKGLQGLKGYAI